MPPSALVLLPRERRSSSATGAQDGRDGAAGGAGAAGSGEHGSPGPWGAPVPPEAAAPGDAPAGASDSGSPGASGSSGAPGSPGAAGGTDDNPFAPPPEGRPDEPWRPRHPGQGDDSRPGQGDGQDGPPVWGSQWSSRQPGRSSGGFGGRTGGPARDPYGGGRQGQGQGQGGPGGGMRWDPSDVLQRRARYALLAGMWAFFFALFSLPEVALLLGALAVYWACSSLRGKAGKGDKDAGGGGKAAADRPDPFATPSRPAPHAPYPSTSDRAYATAGPHHPHQQPQPSVRPQAAAAVTGLVAAVLALVIVAGTYAIQLAYHDYYSCVNDALTKEGQVACNTELPKSLVPVFGIKE